MTAVRRAGVPAAVVVAQLLWWPLGPGWLGEAVDLHALWVVAPLTCLSAAAVALRRTAAEQGFAAGLVAGTLGIVLPASTPGLDPSDVVAGWLAAALTLWALTMSRTAAVSAAGAACIPVLGAVIALLNDARPRSAAGVAVLSAGAVAVLWSAARLRRRTRARRRAVREYRAAAHRLPAHAAAAERRRLAAELHDVAAHRMTAVVVSAAAALRLDQPQRRSEALAHAVGAGRAAGAELDRLVSLEAREEVVTDVDIRLLAEQHGVGTYTRRGGPLPAARAALAYRVIRESLTNVARYAQGARTEVLVDAEPRGLVVQVRDHGGSRAGEGLGSGTGLAGLAAAVRAAGGAVTAGPRGTGWQVQAFLPVAEPAPPRSTAGSEVTGTALTLAPVVAAAGLSLAVVLLPSADDPDLLAGPGPAAALLALLLAHAATLAWRRAHPIRALLVAVTVLGVWLLAARAGAIRLNPADIFLGAWWIELVLLYSVGAGRPARRGWWPPILVSVVGGAALAQGAGIHGSRAGASLVLALLLLAPTCAAWWIGRLVALRRRRLAARDAAARTAEHQVMERATSLARAQLADRLRREARAHANAVVIAAESGELTAVVAEGRATLAALRALIHHPAEAVPEPPPGWTAVAELAARRHASLRVTGSAVPVPTAVEVAAYRAVEAMIDDLAAVEIERRPAGVQIRLRGGRVSEKDFLRRVRDIVDEAAGRVDVEEDGATVRVWLPSTLN